MPPPATQTRPPMAVALDLWDHQTSSAAAGAAGAAGAQSPGWGWKQLARHAAWRVRAATVALWLLIAVAAAGGLRGALATGGAPSLPGSAQGAGNAGGFAEQFVATYLEAGAGDSLAAFYPGPVDLAGVTASARYVARASAVATEPLGPGYWAVTVAADVLDQVAGGYEQGGTSYYRVGVHAGAGGEVATSLPALVPGPKPAPPPRLAVPAPSSPPPADLATALTDFFTTYLSRAGPPPTSVTVTAASLGTPGANHTRIGQVDVMATDSGMRAQLLAYSVRLAATPTGWTVQGVLPAPPVAATAATADNKEGHP